MIRTISHGAAKRLLDSLQGDGETVEQLRSYIVEQQHGPKDWDTVTDKEHSIIASTRAIEAISRVQTFNEDLSDANARIDRLEASQRDLSDIVAALLEIIEAR